MPRETIQQASSDTNMAYLTDKVKMIKCPYCNEDMDLYQIRYKIVKVRFNKEGNIVRSKIMPSACGWNCSRRAIDKMNSERTQEEIDKGVEYRRG